MIKTSDYIKSSLHTHTTFCDGKQSIEENILSALEKGLSVIGFSSHSMYPFWTKTYMQPEDFNSYCKEIRSLSKKYASKIQVRLAFEADYIPGVTFPSLSHYADFKPDYLIGSIHFIYQKDGLFAVDDTVDILKEGSEKFYQGNFKPLIQDYFALEREMLQKGDFQILGHPDLIRKFNEKSPFFDENESWYKEELKSLTKALAQSEIATEINTGAISRGYLKKPYPSDYFLSLLHDAKVPIAITADAHSKENLDSNFDLALNCAKKAGYSEIIYDVTSAGYKFCKI